jgi:hypothetical protein
VRAPQIGFSQLVQDFFLRRLIAQRGASARTVEAYRVLRTWLSEVSTRGW